MTTATAVEPPRTLADLHARVSALADIPPERILLHPWPGSATEADLVALAVGEPKCLCELIDGTLVEKAVGTPSSNFGIFLVELLSAYVRTRNLGVLTMADGMFRLFAGRVRMPDIAYISWDRLPGRQRPTEPVWDVAPNLAIEILSPLNTPGEMRRKRDDFFATDVQLVWEIDPVARTVAVFTRPDAPDAVLAVPAVLDAAPVLPGVTPPLADLFGEFDRHG
jgi:Uma2 family endonuclease